VLAAAVAASTAALIGQTAPTTVAGHVSINTSSNRRTTAVSVKRDAKGSVEGTGKSCIGLSRSPGCRRA
jgi:hypothetical protein